MSEITTRILAQIDQLKIALRNELCEDTPNQDTILAIEGRIRGLDAIAHRHIMAGVA